MKQNKLNIINRIKSELQKVINNADFCINEMYEGLAVVCDTYPAFDEVKPKVESYFESYNGSLVRVRYDEKWVLIMPL